MTLDDELEKLELALDDHYDGYENLVESIEETEDAQEALTHLAEIVNIQGDLGYSGEQVVKGVTTYLLNNREHMDIRALELKNNQDRLEEVLDNHASGDSGFADRVLEKWFGDYTLPTALWKSEVRGEPDIDHNKRKTLAAMVGVLGGSALGASAADYANGDGGSQTQAAPSNPYASLPEEGNRVQWGQLNDYLTDDSVQQLKNDVSAVEENIGKNLNLSWGEWELQYESVENGEVKGHAVWYLPDETLRSDEGNNVDEISFDNLAYRGVRK